MEGKVIDPYKQRLPKQNVSNYVVADNKQYANTLFHLLSRTTDFKKLRVEKVPEYDYKGIDGWWYPNPFRAVPFSMRWRPVRKRYSDLTFRITANNGSELSRILKSDTWPHYHFQFYTEGAKIYEIIIADYDKMRSVYRNGKGFKGPYPIIPNSDGSSFQPISFDEFIIHDCIVADIVIDADNRYANRKVMHCYGIGGKYVPIRDFTTANFHLAYKRPIECLHSTPCVFPIR